MLSVPTESLRCSDLTLRCETMTDALNIRASLHPDKTAFRFVRPGCWDETSISYGELARRSRALGSRLAALNTKGRAVMLVLPSGLEYVIGLFGCFYSGGIAVPLFPPLRHQRERIETIARDCDAVVALTTPSLFERVSKELVRLKSDCVLLPLEHADGTCDTNFPDKGPSRDSLALIQYTSGSTRVPGA